jgi:hypothetical protein
MSVVIDPELMGIRSDRYKDLTLLAQEEGCEMREEPGPAIGSVYVTLVFTDEQSRESFLHMDCERFGFKHEIGEKSPISSCFPIRSPDGCSQKHMIKP